jgi:transcriptional regulator with XRE-family HTH domain
VTPKRPYPSLRHWREANAIRQCDAARKLGVSQSFYSRLEHGIYFPGRLRAKAIADETGVPLETLLGLVDAQ